MNTTAMLRASGDSQAAPGGAAAAGIGLWVFMAVATSLFSLFIAAYVMRMNQTDWTAIAMPWQLWLSTALLVAGSVLLQQASAAARAALSARARFLLLAGGLCALAFLLVQLWAWQTLQAIHVMPAGSPAASFFYLLTAMHGLHVAGGIGAWGWVARSAWREPTHVAWRIALCARYWHFLLAVWVVLFATLGWLTPEAVRFICGTR